MNRHEIPRSAHVCDYRTSCTVVDILVVSHEDLIEGVSVQKIRMVAEQWLLCSWREWFGFGL